MLNDAKFVQEGNALHVTTGPATTFWNPANTASGDYTVKATFLEPKFMELNSHPHSYGIFIGGNNMGTDQMSYVYCVAYGDGNALVRGFGPAVFTLLGTSPNAGGAQGRRRRPAGDAGDRVARQGRPRRVLDQRHGGRRLRQGPAGGAGKLQSTDGVYGIRFTHNVEAIITGFAMTKGLTRPWGPLEQRLDLPLGVVEERRAFLRARSIAWRTCSRG